ncbi:hypothetical protein [Gemmobacter nectariphilus]|uniref:hypothetical protein n=1 Tax=Gemmobacter nectariphilus TaxID=220343 RepID=UPI00040208B8|nr:hypothetical protein [Gemmobacter nectariphilus]
MRLVRFVRPHRLWNRGEVAGFSDQEVDRLVAARLAVPLDAEAGDGTGAPAIELTEPTAPTEPTEPTEPTAPTEPTEASEPTEIAPKAKGAKS